ncbi:hypothetical protein C8Q80DRAFT_751453 [Daedaleopsis nitida]|nr:hypothetical protein C8Q80DRAFT_751453 [Daedaleopsis nitida]
MFLARPARTFVGCVSWLLVVVRARWLPGMVPLSFLFTSTPLLVLSPIASVPLHSFIIAYPTAMLSRNGQPACILSAYAVTPACLRGPEAAFCAGCETVVALVRISRFSRKLDRRARICWRQTVLSGYVHA